MSTPDAFDALLDPQMLREYREELAELRKKLTWTHAAAAQFERKMNEANARVMELKKQISELEGVAAPLEPSKLNAEKFYDDVYEGDDACVIWNMPTSDKVGEIWQFAEAYAAAVSKNLTDKYSEMEAKWMRELLTVSNEIGAAREELAQAKSSNWANRRRADAAEGKLERLEKEIAALRETK